MSILGDTARERSSRHGVFIKLESPFTSHQDTRGLIIPKEPNHETGKTKKIQERSQPELSTPFPNQGTVSPWTTRPTSAPAVSEQEARRSLLARLSLSLSILPPSTRKASLKGLKKGLPGEALGVPFPRHGKSSPSHLNAPGFLHET